MSPDSTCSSQSLIRVKACFRRLRKTSDLSVPAFDTAIVCDEYRAFVVFVNADQDSQSRCCLSSSNARSVTDRPRPPSSDAASHLYRVPFVSSRYLFPLTLDLRSIIDAICER